MKNLLLICGMLALAGCVSSSGEDVPGPSGNLMSEAKCNGSPSGCFKKANAVCKGPYQVLDSSSNAGGLVADILPGPITWYKMTFQCGKSDGRMPSFPFRGQSYRAPSVTNCTGWGNSVSCTSY